MLTLSRLTTPILLWLTARLSGLKAQVNICCSDVANRRRTLPCCDWLQSANVPLFRPLRLIFKPLLAAKLANELAKQAAANLRCPAVCPSRLGPLPLDSTNTASHSIACGVEQTPVLLILLMLLLLPDVQLRCGRVSGSQCWSLWPHSSVRCSSCCLVSLYEKTFVSHVCKSLNWCPNVMLKGLVFCWWSFSVANLANKGL